MTKTEILDRKDMERAYEKYQCATSNRWKDYWYDACETIFLTCRQYIYDYIIDQVKRTIKRIQMVGISVRKTKYDGKILISEDCPNLMDDKNQKCYLFEFLDRHGNTICSKVGTTTRKVVQRLKEELKSDTYKALGCEKAVVHRVYDCGDVPAEGMESFFRATYISRFPNSFKKNDRFILQKFDLEEADKIAKKYQEMCGI